jgi:hypothetical protein
LPLIFNSVVCHLTVSNPLSFFLFSFIFFFFTLYYSTFPPTHFPQCLFLKMLFLCLFLFFISLQVLSGFPITTSSSSYTFSS